MSYKLWIKNNQSKKTVHCSLFTVHPSLTPLPQREGVRGRAGFTLIELLVVLIVIGIASSLIGIFVYSGIDNVRLNTFAREISSTLRYARTHAVSEKKTYSFIIHGKEKAYGLYAGSGPVIYKQFPSDKLQAALKGSSEEDIRIDFSLYGSSTGGTIEVKGTDGPIWHISVSRVTGKVEVGKVKS